MPLSKFYMAVMISAAMAFSVPALAQVAPFKLVILWGDSGVAVIEYPTATRCEAAKAVLEHRKAQELEKRKPEFPPGGGIIVPKPWVMEMICIPG